MSSSAPRPAYASTQPWRPQLQSRPPGFEQTWPISPAEPRPVRCRPSITMPPPTPVPQKTPRNESSPRPAPKRCSASTATLTSFPSFTGRPSSSARAGPSSKGESHPSMFATWSTVPVPASISPGAPMPIPASPIGSTPASSRAARRVSASSKATATGPPLRGVSRRALPSTVASPSVTTAWILVPPRSSPPFIRVTAAIARPPRAASGSPARSTPAPCAGPHRAAAPGGRTRARSSGSRSRRPTARSGRARRRRSPFGHDASPSAQAARSMLCAARPASNITGPLPATRIATTRPAPSTLRGDVDSLGELLDPGSSRRHRESPGLGVPRRAGEPARVEQAEDELWRQRRRQGATLVATAGDREQRVHVCTLSPRRPEKGRRPGTRET